MRARVLVKMGSKRSKAARPALLALALLILNGRRDWVGDLHNRWPSVIILGVTLVFFGWTGVQELWARIMAN